MKRFIGVTVMLGLVVPFTLLANRSESESENGLQAMHKEEFHGGSVKVLFMAPYSAHIDSYELMQRFDIEGTVIPVCDNYSVQRKAEELGFEAIYYPQLGIGSDEVIKRIRAAIKTDWDIIVLSVFPGWSVYPEDIRFDILNYVKSGKSLVVAGFKNGLTEDLKKLGLELVPMEGNLAEKFPFRKTKNGTMKGYNCGKGKMIHYYYLQDSRLGFMLTTTELQSEFEYSASRMGWLLHHLAKGDKKSEIKTVLVDDDTSSIDIVSSIGPCADGLSSVIRRVDNYEAVFDKQIKIKNNKDIKIKLPQLSRGEYLVEVKLFSDSKLLDWRSTFFKIDAPIKIKNLVLSSNDVKAGEKILGKIDIDGIADNMTIRWYDNYHRLLMEKKQIPFRNEIELKVPVNSYSVINKIEVEIISDGKSQDRKTIEILMKDNAIQSDFYVVYWNGAIGSSWRTRLYLDLLRKAGKADALSNCPPTVPSIPRSAALANLRTIPYTTAFHNITLSGQLMNEKWLKETEQKARDTANIHKRYGELAYTLGDENYVSPFKQEGRFAYTDEIKEGFQEYLKKSYSSIGKLNLQWQANYTDWHDIIFESEKDMLADHNNPSAWMDYRMYVTDKLASAYQRMRKAIQQEDPGAIVGFDGAEQFSCYDGYDWWKLTRDMGLVNIYSRYFSPNLYPNKIFNGKVLSSFSTDAKLKGGFINTADIDYGGRYDTWYIALHGWNSVWWWSASFLQPEYGALTWQMESTRVAKDMVEAAEEIKKGPATLLKHAKQYYDPIAVHYSANNFNACTIESGIGTHVNNLGVNKSRWMANDLAQAPLAVIPDKEEVWKGLKPKGHYVAASANFYLLLDDLGFQSQSVARQQIEVGELINSNFKVLILPFVVSLSEEEIKRIRDFVTNGGLLIADYRCAVRDAHGRFRQKPALDDVFGISRVNRDVVRKRMMTTVDSIQLGGVEYESIFHENIVPSESCKTYGVHDDGTFSFFVNKFGKGTAVYLNSDLYVYDGLRRTGLESGVRSFFGKLLLKYSGLEPEFTVKNDAGKPLSHTTITHFQDGDISYFGVLPDYGVDNVESREAILSFPRKGHVYNVRKHQYIGFGKDLPQKITDGNPEFFATLPYVVENISLKSTKEVKRGEVQKVYITVNNNIAGNWGSHAASIQVYYPDGREVDVLSRTIHLPNGAGEFLFTPALNAPIGLWKIIAIESVSGKQAEMSIIIK